MPNNNPVAVAVAVPVVETVASGALREYYLRSNKVAPLEGPYTFYEAEYKARWGTRLAKDSESAVVELVVLLGTRLGDPPQPTDPTLKVVAIYVKGRKTLGGSIAQYNSDQRNT